MEKHFRTSPHRKSSLLLLVAHITTRNMWIMLKSKTRSQRRAFLWRQIININPHLEWNFLFELQFITQKWNLFFTVCHKLFTYMHEIVKKRCFVIQRRVSTKDMKWKSLEETFSRRRQRRRSKNGLKVNNYQIINESNCWIQLVNFTLLFFRRGGDDKRWTEREKKCEKNEPNVISIFSLKTGFLRQFNFYSWSILWSQQVRRAGGKLIFFTSLHYCGDDVLWKRSRKC